MEEHRWRECAAGYYCDRCGLGQIGVECVPYDCREPDWQKMRQLLLDNEHEHPLDEEIKSLRRDLERWLKRPYMLRPENFQGRHR